MPNTGKTSLLNSNAVFMFPCIRFDIALVMPQPMQRCFVKNSFPVILYAVGKMTFVMMHLNGEYPIELTGIIIRRRKIIVMFMKMPLGLPNEIISPRSFRIGFFSLFWILLMLIFDFSVLLLDFILEFALCL